jgi:hypothetical protein
MYRRSAARLLVSVLPVLQLISSRRQSSTNTYLRMPSAVMKVAFGTDPYSLLTSSILSIVSLPRKSLGVYDYCRLSESCAARYSKGCNPPAHHAVDRHKRQTPARRTAASLLYTQYVKRVRPISWAIRRIVSHDRRYDARQACRFACPAYAQCVIIGPNQTQETQP